MHNRKKISSPEKFYEWLLLAKIPHSFHKYKEIKSIWHRFAGCALRDTSLSFFDSILRAIFFIIILDRFAGKQFLKYPRATSP